MEIFPMIIIAILAFVAGYFVAWIFLNRKNRQQPEMERLKKENDDLILDNRLKAKEIESLDRETGRLREALGESRERVVELNASLSAGRADLRNLNEKLAGQQKEFDKISEKFTLEFKALANDILRKESKTFAEQNKSQIETLLKPLGEKIKDFEKRVEETYDKESQQRFSLKEEVKRLSELNRQIGTEARNLTEALKGQTKTQGNWGELVLENILEKSGLSKDREFFVQKSFKSEDGRRLQPDVLLSLPGGKNVVVDAKVSLTAYEQFVSAETEEDKKQAFKRHLISVKKHVEELASKNYQRLYGLKSLDFVIMFLPVEPAFLSAVKADPNLWSFAYEKGVLLIGPTNLFATLKMVSSLWQQEYQNRNVMEIARESGKLYDKFVGFVKDLDDIGDKLNAARRSYDQAYGKLSTGRGNLVSRAEKIKSLGAPAGKSLPGELTGDLGD